MDGTFEELLNLSAMLHGDDAELDDSGEAPPISLVEVNTGPHIVGLPWLTLLCRREVRDSACGPADWGGGSYF